MLKKRYFPKLKSVRGSLLLELIIVIALLSIILTIGAQAVTVSLKSGKVAGERDVAAGLASEELEAVRGSSEEKWQNLYILTKTSQNYYATTSANKWTIATGTETITINNAVYTRYFTVSNVSRDQTIGSRLIETSYNSAHDDPSTQQVTVTVSWTGGVPFTTSDYFLRWKNKTCSQTSWSGGTAVGGSSACAGATTYDNSTNIGFSSSTIQIQ